MDRVPEPNLPAVAGYFAPDQADNPVGLAGRPEAEPAGYPAGPSAPTGFTAVLIFAGTAMTLTYLIARIQGGDPEGVVHNPPFLAALTFLLAGGLIVPRQPRNAVGWLFVTFGLATGAVAVTGSLAGARTMFWMNQWLPAFAFGLLPPALLLFPNGRLAGRRWRYALRFTVVALGISAIPLAVATWLEPKILFDFSLRAGSAGDLAARAFALARIGSLLVIAASAVAALSLLQRLKKEHGDPRQQIKLLLLGTAAIPVGIVLEILSVQGAELLIATTVPLAAATAVLKYRLYDIDLFINRSLVYAILTVLLTLTYVTAVSVLGTVTGEFASPLVASATIAVAFQPLRQRVQQAVGRLLYGHRNDPYTAMQHLGRILEPAIEPEALFRKLAESIADALRLPFVAVETVDAAGTNKLVVSLGRRVETAEEFPMIHDGRLVGRLSVSPRTLGKGFSSLERSILQDLSRQSAVAVHALELTEQLRASRARLVHSREDERLRLRRELHDGVGPALAGATMKIAQARQVAPEGRADALNRLEEILQGCLIEIRLIVEGLRPSSLDALGLAEAIRRSASVFEGDEGGLLFAVAAPAELRLPAAVEVAAYRIASEAITNAARHSSSRHCRITLELGRDLILRVEDDGCGMPQAWSPGMGTTTMKERAEELGGQLTISSTESGTCVVARLPVATG
ncbi:MAG: sensor histidine kinase [Actinomycetota bacterium]